MLKKAGIVVAATAAGLLAVGSFAFADETVSKDNLGNACTFGTTGSTVTTSNTEEATAVGAVVQSIIEAVAPVDTQAQAGNCTNVKLKDLVDAGSGNTTKTVDETLVKDSFNQ